VPSNSSATTKTVMSWPMSYFSMLWNVTSLELLSAMAPTYTKLFFRPYIFNSLAILLPLLASNVTTTALATLSSSILCTSLALRCINCSDERTLGLLDPKFCTHIAAVLGSSRSTLLMRSLCELSSPVSIGIR
jgi:hypothetical protein